jgi:hypothetical protein
MTNSAMRRLNLMLFVIVVAIILFSVVRAFFGTASQKRHEPRRGPAATAQATAKRG